MTYEEVVESLKISKNSSPGPDQVPNILLKTLSETVIIYLKNLLNLIFLEEVFPEQWTLATVIPIPKPAKDKPSPKNYRPISLTNNLCKLLERILNKRLVALLETNKVFVSQQSGFRQNRSTYDHLITLESAICDAFHKERHVIAVSIDIDKAIEMIWRHRVIKILEKHK